MAAEGWHRTRELFESALEVPAAERAAWLAARCGEDAALLAQVHALLHADAEESKAGQLLDAGAAEHLLPALGGLPVAGLAGTRIGAFRLLRMLGAGGMGTVYEAEQDQPRRLVAVKLLRMSLASPDAHRRFAYEAEVLGRLRHPHIAQVFDAGTHTDGGLVTPWFAMELVEDARPLDRWVAEERPGLPARLELFRSVCDAAHHGHQRGVVHRDLKPANVLVDRAGRPKVIDFGIARAIGGAAGLTHATLPGQLLGTLACMSPEQLDGQEQDIDARSDVHALGVLLFELLTGGPPLSFAGLTLPAAIQAARTASVPAPSTRPDPCGGPLPRELDWIVLRATDKERARRYGSAQELAAEVERFQRHEPLLAGPPGMTYRLRKLARRHRLAVTAAMAVLLAVLGGGIAAAVGFVQASQAEALALARLAQAQREAENRGDLVQLLRDMMSSVQSEKQGREVRVVDLLDRSAAALGPVERGQPLRALLFHSTLGTAYMDLGLFDKARAHYERGFALARTLGDTAEAETLTLHNNFGLLLGRVGQPAEGEQHLRQAIAGRTRRFGAGHVETGIARANLAMVLKRRDQLAEAEGELRAALAIVGSQVGPADQRTIQIQASLANVLASAEAPQLEAAERMAEAARAAAVDHLGPEHPVTTSILASLAAVQSQRGRHAEAAATYRQALAVDNKVFGPQHERVFRLRNNLAAALQSAGQLVEAEAELRAALADAPAGDRTDPARVLTAQGNLAAVVERLGRYPEALELFDQTLARAATVLPKSHYLQAVFRRGRGVCLTALGRLDEADTELTLALRILDHTKAPEERFRRRTLEALAELRDKQGRSDQAATLRAELEAAGGATPAPESAPARRTSARGG